MRGLVGSVLVVAPQTPPPLKVSKSPILILVLLYTLRKCMKVYSTDKAVGQLFCKTTRSCIIEP